MSQTHPPNVVKRAPLRLLLSPGVWVFVMITVGGIWALHSLNQNGGLDYLRTTLGIAAPLITIPLHVAISVSPLPSDFICVANGAFYGFWNGAACSWIGWWIAGCISFWIGREIRRGITAEQTGRIPAWLRRFPLDHPLFLILGRQIPGVGGYLTTYGAGAIGVSWQRHAWCSAIAIAPGSFVLAAAGAALTSTK